MLNPKLVLTLNNVPYTFTAEDILQRSITFHYQDLADLSVSASHVTLKVLHSSTIESILAQSTIQDIAAVLYEGSSAVFTGKLNPALKKNISSDDLSNTFDLSIEDNSYKLNKTFPLGEYISGTGTECIEELLSKAGIYSSNIPTISSSCGRLVKEGENLKTVLEDLLKEVGYTYNWNADGSINFRSIYTITPITTLTEANLSNVTLSRNAKSYQNVAVSFDQYELRTSVLVFNDVTNQSSEHPHCYIEVAGNSYYPDTANATTFARVTANDSAGGNEIINIVGNIAVSADPTGTFTYEVNRHSANELNVRAKNTTSTTDHITKFEARANVVMKTATSKATDIDTSDTSALYETTATWLHSVDPVKNYRSFLSNYFAYSNYGYSFVTDVDFDLGDCVTLSYKGSTQTVIINSKQYSDIGVTPQGGIRYTYGAYSVSEYVYKDSAIDTTYNPSGLISGQIGKSYRYRGAWNSTTEYLNNEQYIDTVTYNGAFYVCLITGTNHTPGDTTYWGLLSASGTDGVDGTALVEYAISSSSTEYVQVVSWGCIPSDNWAYGTYPWRRTVLIDIHTGEKSYGTPMFDAELYNSYLALCELKFTPTQTSYTLNERDANNSNQISLYLVDNGFSCDSYEWDTGNDYVTVEDSGEGYYLLTIPYATTKDLTLTITVTGYKNNVVASTYSTTLYGVDKSDKAHYFSKCGSAPSSLGAYPLLEGDFYVDTSTSASLIRVYTTLDDGTLGWRTIRNGDADYDSMCSEAMNDVLSTINPDSVTASDFGYFNTIISRSITSDKISALTLERGYEEDADHIPISGYKIEANGTPNIRAGAATFGNVTISGLSTFSSPALTTTNDSISAQHLYGTYTDCEVIYYNYDTISSALGSGNWLSASGMYNGEGVYGYRGTADANIYTAGVSGVGDSDRSTTFTCPCTGDYVMYIQPTIYGGFIFNLGCQSGAIRLRDNNTGGDVFYAGQDGGWTSQYTKSVRLVRGHSYTLTVYTSKGGYWTWNQQDGSASIYDTFSAKGFATSNGFMKLTSGWSTSITNALVVNGSSVAATLYYCYEVEKVSYKDGTLGAKGTYVCNEASSTVTKNGVTKSGFLTLTISDGGALFTWADGSTVSLGAHDYMTDFSYDAYTASKSGLVEAVDIFPKSNTNSIGSLSRPWAAGYFTALPEGSSSRTIKKDVKNYEKSALDLINGTQVVSYRYSNIEGDHERVGFIAEDTDKTLSVDGKHVDSGSCIGVLLKAVQELSQEIEDLKRR